LGRGFFGLDMVNSALVFTRGPVIAVYVHKGSDVYDPQQAL
jgi:hypothetical protein